MLGRSWCSCGVPSGREDGRGLYSVWFANTARVPIPGASLWPCLFFFRVLREPGAGLCSGAGSNFLPGPSGTRGPRLRENPIVRPCSLVSAFIISDFI